MTSLETLIKERIRSSGPLPLQSYMQMALSHPEYGYYQKADPFGKGGDFVTAPEISQMFGELIGLWCVDAWAKMGMPTTFNLIELGPGNGTLMADVLRAAVLAPEFKAAVQLHLVETSNRLRAIQKKKLKSVSATWHTEFPEIDDGPCLIIANEFFDALPIQQYEVLDGQWFEKQVGLMDDQLALFLANKPSLNNEAELPDSASLEDGTLFETNKVASEIVAQISRQICRQGGAALIVDYGPLESGFGNSFQAVQNHRYVDPLENPGSADLTAHVDFEHLSDTAKNNGCDTLPITSQGRFLERLGIEARAMLLSKKASEPNKEKIVQDLRRLVSKDGMGTLFKALSFYHSMSLPPAGFGD